MENEEEEEDKKRKSTFGLRYRVPVVKDHFKIA